MSYKEKPCDMWDEWDIQEWINDKKEQRSRKTEKQTKPEHHPLW